MQVKTDYQEHSGGVNTGTSLKVQYSFADGSANTVRPTGMTYPNGAVVGTAYTSAQASFLSRPDQVTDVAGSATVFASMRYLGLGTLVGLNYDGASNLNLTYQNGGTGTAGDKYTGLDRFGRIIETIWIKGTGDVVQGVYGRNRSSGIDWRRDDEASSTIAMDALYSYDGLQQVTSWKRGNLSPSTGPPYTGVTSKKQGEDFTYDQTGNWLGDVSDNPNFTQSRTHNVNNQITAITGPTGVIQPVYDNAGNMTLAPSPGSWTAGYTYKWDAWNRLVEIKQGGTVIGSYAYDALTRRTRKTVGGVTRDIYYDRQWRSVEERDTSTGTVKVQHAWSPLDRWTLIRRKRNASGSTLNETLFCLRDYLDPVALANTSGAVVERYSYDAFGTVRIMNAAFGVLGNSAYEWEFLYHGEFRDKESELYNYGYRYLDTQLGRWLSRDPIEEEGGLNLYVIFSKNSVNSIDFIGLETKTSAPWLKTAEECGLKYIQEERQSARDHFHQAQENQKLNQDGKTKPAIKPFEIVERCGRVCCKKETETYYCTVADRHHSFNPPAEGMACSPSLAPECEADDPQVGWWHTHPGRALIRTRGRTKESKEEYLDFTSGGGISEEDINFVAVRIGRHSRKPMLPHGNKKQLPFAMTRLPQGSETPETTVVDKNKRIYKYVPPDH